MKTVIIGSGALGLLIAALLAKSKADVSLLCRRKETAERINNDGICVEGLSGKWKSRIKVLADPANISQADLIIVCVKSYDTKTVANSLPRQLSSAAKILTLQNGLGNIEAIAEAVGEDNVIGGTTNIGATLLEDGKVRYAGKGETVIGRMDGQVSVEMREIRTLFSTAGMELKISREIKSILWSKLVVNSGINALTAITRLQNGALVKSEGAKRIMSAAVAEAVKVAKRKKIRLIYDDPLAKAETVCEATADNNSSMLQDVLHKKKTEIDAINGTIVRIAQEAGIAVPVNSLLIDMVKSIEENYKAGG